MNFKFSLFFAILFLLAGCGVKQKPMRPVDMLVPSYIQSFTPTEATPIEATHDKKSETDPTTPQPNLSNP